MFTAQVAAPLVGKMVAQLRRHKYVDIVHRDSDGIPGMVEINAQHDPTVKGTGRAQVLNRKDFDAAYRHLGECEKLANLMDEKDPSQPKVHVWSFNVPTAPDSGQRWPFNGKSWKRATVAWANPPEPETILPVPAAPAISEPHGGAIADPAGERLTLARYSERAVIITGNTYSHRARIKSAVPKAHGIFHRKAKGWIFSAKHETALREALGDLLAA